MDTNNGNQTDIKTESVEYNKDNNYYIFNLSFNSEQIIINIKNEKTFQYKEYESKFNFNELKSFHIFFIQFKNVEIIGNLFLNLIKGNKITLYEKYNLIILFSLILQKKKLIFLLKKTIIE